MEYGYIRVSSQTQNVARQVAKMRALGLADDALFIDHASGKDMERPEWKRLMATVKEGDLIIIDSLDRLGRNYDLVTAEWRRITRGMGVDIRALDLDFMDSSSFRRLGSIGRVMEDNILSLLAYVAQTEREKIRQRQAEGIAVAKANGVYDRLGVDMDAARMLFEAVDGGGMTATDASKALGVSRRTWYRIRERSAAESASDALGAIPA